MNAVNTANAAADVNRSAVWLIIISSKDKLLHLYASSKEDAVDNSSFKLSKLYKQPVSIAFSGGVLSHYGP